MHALPFPIGRSTPPNTPSRSDRTHPTRMLSCLHAGAVQPRCRVFASRRGHRGAAAAAAAVQSASVQRLMSLSQASKTTSQQLGPADLGAKPLSKGRTRADLRAGRPPAACQSQGWCQVTRGRIRLGRMHKCRS
eukprot:363781-Chlamydomonas_euryale.AAC.4